MVHHTRCTYLYISPFTFVCLSNKSKSLYPKIQYWERVRKIRLSRKFSSTLEGGGGLGGGRRGWGKRGEGVGGGGRQILASNTSFANKVAVMPHKAFTFLQEYRHKSLFFSERTVLGGRTLFRVQGRAVDPHHFLRIPIQLLFMRIRIQHE